MGMGLCLTRRKRRNEEGVMVDHFFTTINMGKHADLCLFVSFLDTHVISRHQVEVSGVKVYRGCEILDHKAVMSRLVIKSTSVGRTLWVQEAY